MPHVVCQPCYGCKYTDCVAVCPVECFREGEKMLYIHPGECIDCGACVPACPVDAIFPAEEVPSRWRQYLTLNAELSLQCQRITEPKKPRCQDEGELRN